MDNPIEFRDLFGDDLTSGIGGLTSQVASLKNELEDAVTKIKAIATEASNSLKSLSIGNDPNGSETKKKVKDVQELYTAYETLGLELDETTKELERLLATESKMDKARKLNKVAIGEQEGSMARLNAQLQLCKMAYEGMSTAQREEEGEGKKLLATIQHLNTTIKGLESSLKATEKSTSNVEKSLKGVSTASTQTTDKANKLLSVYGLLSAEEKLIAQEATHVAKSQSEINKVQDLAIKVATSAEGSYNRLAASYNLVKVALNAMSLKERESTKNGQELVAMAKALHDEMDRLQKSTGNASLSVGNYADDIGKAMNGLRISTIQVAREIPTIANSWSQFFIAISNNVPIFVEDARRASIAMGGLGNALKAMITPWNIFSLLLPVVMMLLPMVAKKIHDKKKALAEMNGELEKAVTYLEMMEEALNDVAHAQINDLNKLRTLNAMLTDSNRTYEERVKVGKVLKEEWQEELEMYSAEEIAIGKATGALEMLINKLVAEAEARALLNEIAEQSIKHYDMQTKYNKAIDDRTIAESRLNEALQRKEVISQRAQEEVEMYGQTTARTASEITKITKEVKHWQDAISDANATMVHWDSQMQDVENSIQSLRDMIKVDAFPLNKNGGKGGKLLEIPSYYNEALQAMINTMRDSLQKELYQQELDFKKSMEKRKEQEEALIDMMKTASGERLRTIKTELSNLRILMEQEDTYYLLERQEIIKKWLKFNQEIVDEEVDYDEEARKLIRINLTNEMERANSESYALYEKGALKKQELDELIRDSEHTYWANYLQELKDNGLLTIQIYNDVMAKLVKAEESATSKSRRGKRSHNLRSIVDVAMASSSYYGGYNEESMRREVLEEWKDYSAAINTALNSTMNSMDAWMAKRIEMAEVAIQMAKKEVDAAKKKYDWEEEARANGYANNVELARKEWEERLEIERKAEKEKEKLERAQLAMDTAQQMSSLITATANIWSAEGLKGILGVPLAVAATSAMWSAFAASKVMAMKSASKVTYGDGMSEYLDYGGSHASGHDIDFGTTKDGTRRRVERGEMIGVINKKNVNKYGVDEITNIIKSLNNGTFEKFYSPSVVEGMLQGSFSDKYGLAFNNVLNTDMSGVEKGINTLIAQGEKRVVTTPYGRIEYSGKNKRIIRN